MPTKISTQPTGMSAHFLLDVSRPARQTRREESSGSLDTLEFSCGNLFGEMLSGMSLFSLLRISISPFPTGPAKTRQDKTRDDQREVQARTQYVRTVHPPHAVLNDIHSSCRCTDLNKMPVLRTCPGTCVPPHRVSPFLPPHRQVWNIKHKATLGMFHPPPPSHFSPSLPQGQDSMRRLNILKYKAGYI